MIDYKDERLTWLLAQTADRPAHARFLEEVIRLEAAGRAGDEWPSKESTKGVSNRVQEAIEADVASAFLNLSGFGQYESVRRAGRVAARKRAETRNSLQALLRIGN